MIRNNDINCFNEGKHITGYIDDQSRWILFSRRNKDSGVDRPPELLPYLEEFGFAHVARVRDFHFDNSLLSTFVNEIMSRDPFVPHAVG
ncbi:hypothetical protein AHAS_Ahas12G0190800 [Arachis hypogaea]